MATVTICPQRVLNAAILRLDTLYELTEDADEKVDIVLAIQDLEAMAAALPHNMKVEAWKS